MPRVRWAVAIVVSVMAVAGGPRASADHATSAGLGQGAFVPWGFNDSWFSSAAAGDINLAADIQKAGFRSDRFKVQWQLVQPCPTTDLATDAPWAATDALLNEMTDRGVVPVMEITNAPGWANGSSSGCALGTPEYGPLVGQLGAFESFVKAAITRYDAEILATEVWNEPNHPTYWKEWPAADSRDTAPYIDALEAARAGWNGAASTLGRDPEPLLVGGLTGDGGACPYCSPWEFLQTEVYDADPEAASFFDGVALHPYPLPDLSAGETWRSDMWSRIDAVKAVQLGVDDEKDIWLTEVGVATASSDPNYPTPPSRANQGPLLAELYASLWDHPEIAVFLIHSFRDGALGVGPPWLNMGVWGDDVVLFDKPKPSYCYLNSTIGQGSSGPSACQF